MIANPNAFLEGFSQGLELPPDLLVSEWADQFRQLSPVSSSEHGQWHTDRVPYMRDPMNVLSPSDPTRISVMLKGSQIAATESFLNADFYYIDQVPGPILTVVPSLEFARTFSKERIAPAIEATPVINDRVRPPTARNSGNTVLLKEFDGGIWILAGARSAARLKSMPIRFVHIEEPDDFEEDVGAKKDVEGQGDAIGLSMKRQDTFGDRAKTFMNGTPTIAGLSRITEWYLKGDQRRYFIPCPKCGHMDYLTWSGRDYLRDETDLHHRIAWDKDDPASAHMVCSNPKCKTRIEEPLKTQMLAAGKWIPTAKSAEGIVSWHLSSLYSPYGWKSWKSCVAEWIDSKTSPLKRKIFVNQVLGEPYEEKGETMKPKTLLQRVETYKAEVPNGVGALVANVDVQADRFEIKVKGYGAQEESWLVALERIEADTEKDSAYLKLDRILRRRFVHESGQEMRVLRMTIDAGYRAEQVYRYCKTRQKAGVFAIKGDNGKVMGKPIVGAASTRNQYRAALFMVCTDTAKENVYARLAITDPGPGYMHFPHWATEEYFDQLTSEKGIWKYPQGRRPFRIWKKQRERNEGLDLECGCLVALYIGGQEFVRSLAERALALSKKMGRRAPRSEETDDGSPKAGKRRRLQRSGWVTGGWR